jgi:hypoxanthine-DNA glycosylase
VQVAAEAAQENKKTESPRCFPPVAAEHSRVLILGSFPGVRSLAQQEYYAHPRNAFWPIMGDLFGFDPHAPYGERLQALLDRGVALWDVLHCCERVGSLDAAIDPASVRVNDFDGFFRAHRFLQTVCFNGRRAEVEYIKAVGPLYSALPTVPELVCLPSTSPAMASLRYHDKRDAWRMICDYL